MSAVDVWQIVIERGKLCTVIMRMPMHDSIDALGRASLRPYIMRKRRGLFYSPWILHVRKIHKRCRSNPRKNKTGKSSKVKT